MIDKKDILKCLMDDKPRLFAFAWSLIRDPHSSEDVFQDMIIKALSSENHFESTLHLKNWSRTVIRNQCFDLIKKNKRKTHLSNDLIDKIEQDLDSRDMTHEETSHVHLSDCLNELTEQTREIIKLRYFNNLQALKVAEILDKKPDAIYKTLQRAYQTLKVCLQKKSLLANYD